MKNYKILSKNTFEIINFPHSNYIKVSYLKINLILCEALNPEIRTLPSFTSSESSPLLKIRFICLTVFLHCLSSETLSKISKGCLETKIRGNFKFPFGGLQQLLKIKKQDTLLFCSLKYGRTTTVDDRK